MGVFVMRLYKGDNICHLRSFYRLPKSRTVCAYCLASKVIGTVDGEPFNEQ